MASKEVVSISLQADMKDLKRELSTIPGITKAAAHKMTRELQTQYNKMERATKKSAKATKASWKAAASGAAQVGAAVLGAAVAVFAFAQKMADLNNQLTDAATRTNLTIDQLAGLRLAAEGSGVAFGTLERGLNNLPKAMNDAGRGTGTAALAFKAMDVSVRDAATGGLKSAADILPEIFAGLNAMGPGAEKSAAAMDIFGAKAGGALVQSGAIENMDAFVTLATEFGVNVGPDATKSAADFQREMSTLKLVTEGVLSDMLNQFGGSGGLNDVLGLASQGVVIMGQVFASVFDELNQIIQGIVGPIMEVAIRAIDGDFVGALKAAQRNMDEFGNSAKAITTTAGAFRLAQAGLDGFNKGLEKSNKLRAETEETKEGGRKGGTRDDGGEEDAKESKEAVAAIDDRIKALGKLRDAQDKAAVGRMSKQSQIIAKFVEQEAVIDAAEEAGAAREEIAIARHEAQAQRLRSMHDLQLQQSDERMEKLKQEQDSARATTLAVVQSSGEAFSALGGMLGLAAEKAARSGNKADKKAAKGLFRAQKAASLAIVGLRAAEGFMTAMTLPPPADGIKAFAVGVAAATATASIASAKPPAFDVGGVINGGTPDQIPINVLPGEAVLRREAVSRLGSQGVNELNRGGGGGGGRMIIEQRYRHRSYNAFAQDNLTMASSPLRNAMSDRATPAGRAS